MLWVGEGCRCIEDPILCFVGEVLDGEPCLGAANLGAVDCVTWIIAELLAESCAGLRTLLGLALCLGLG